MNSADRMAVPDVYLYNVFEARHCLYLGGFTTRDALELLPADSRIRIRHLYADTVPTIPERLTGQLSVDMVRMFLEQTPQLVDFECRIDGETVLWSHDDSECRFEFASRELCDAMLISAAPDWLADPLRDALFANPGKYVVMDASRKVCVYATFEDYLATQESR